jgi:hypothetical protein
MDGVTREHDTPRDGGEQALSVLRGIWSAREQTTVDLDEAAGPRKTCKRMAHVGFGGMADEASGQDVRAAWRARLEREGKLGPSSVRDLVLGPDAQR